VHCVIIGFALHEAGEKRIFDYATVQSEPHEIRAKTINPYLIDAPTCLIVKRTTPLCDVPEVNKGSEATDFGFLVLSPEEKADLLKTDPDAANFVRHFIGGEEFINNIERYCLWLRDINPFELKAIPFIMERIRKVKVARLASPKPRTREWAKFPTLFTENRQPESDYLVIPKVSSERRVYIPIGFAPKDWIASGSIQVIPGATLYHFGIISSSMHMAWMRAVAGRMKSDYQYSNTIVYNNFPWPQNPPDRQKQAIEAAAQGVLDARAHYPEASLAALYDPLTMPPDLVRAHQKLDGAVDAAYGRRKFAGDRERLAFLFELYQQLASPLLATKAEKRGKGKK
jgi:hypothetical protein